MSLISLQNVKKFYGRQDVLRGTSFNINPADRVGLIGANGAGKTTLLRLILGKESPDEGQVHRIKGLRLGYLPQDLMSFSGQTLIDLVMDTAEEARAVEAELAFIAADIDAAAAHDNPNEEALLELTDRQSRLLELFENLGGYTLEVEARKILTGLGFTETDFSEPMERYSGGWMMRAALARLLLSRPDIILLDEPTNHLDMDSLLWLETYLLTCPSAVMLVSHDRIFLNNVVQRIIEVDRGDVITYAGNYERYLVEKEKRLTTEAGNFAGQQERIKQIERFIEKNRVRKDRAKQVQSRIKMLDKMDKLEAPVQPGEGLKFHLPKPTRTPEILVELQNVTKAYERNIIYKDLDFTVRRGDRIAFLGANGRGKSTLLKLLAGSTEVTAGSRRLAEGVVMSYFAQFQLEELDPNRTVLEELDTVAGMLSPGRLRTILGSFLFRGDDVFKKVAVLSGGEKTRLILAKIMLVSPNLLLLDEPSNHLDIPGRDMLEAALKEFTGTLCLISHDRHLINAIANKVLVINQGGVEVFPGNFDDYQRIWKDRANVEEPRRPSPRAVVSTECPDNRPAKSETRADRETRRKAEAARRQRLSKLREPLIKEIGRLETRQDELTGRLETITQALADPDTYQDVEYAKLLNIEAGSIKNEIDEVTRLWEEAAVRLEEIDAEACVLT
jgi:ATP-binding cassette, subfamily F, member 3